MTTPATTARTAARNILAAGLTLVAATTAATSAFAACTADDIDRRQARQMSRIDRGMHDGSLTREEAWRLIAEQRRIGDMHRAALRDGYLSHYERDRICEAQEEAGRHIFMERHDGDTRWSRWRNRWWSYDEVRTVGQDQPQGEHRRRRWWW